MAIVTSLALAATLTPNLDVGVGAVTRKINVVSGTASSGDLVQILTFPRAGTLHKVDLRTSATLGAGCTVKLAVGDGTTNVDLTGATTAGSASKVNGSSIGPIDFAAGAKLFAVVGGANIGAAAEVRADLLVQYS